MNSWKFNSIAQHVLRIVFHKQLNIEYSDIYKTIKDINADGEIETKDGKKFKLVLQEI